MPHQFNLRRYLGYSSFFFFPFFFCFFLSLVTSFGIVVGLTGAVFQPLFSGEAFSTLFLAATGEKPRTPPISFLFSLSFLVAMCTHSKCLILLSLSTPFIWRESEGVCPLRETSFTGEMSFHLFFFSSLLFNLFMTDVLLIILIYNIKGLVTFSFFILRTAALAGNGRWTLRLLPFFPLPFSSRVAQRIIRVTFPFLSHFGPPMSAFDLESRCLFKLSFPRSFFSEVNPF